MAPIVIGSNVQSLNAQRRLDSTSNKLRDVYERLSSGQRINSAADDAAGLNIADRLRGDGKIASSAIRNINDGVSTIAIADGALDQIGSVLTRLAELAEQSANGTYSTSQRSALDLEFSALSSEIDRVARTTTFNGVGLLSGGNAIVLQTGFDSGVDSRLTINAVTGTLEGLGLATATAPIYSLNAASSDLGVSASRNALDAVNRAITSLSAARGTLGSAESRLNTAVANLASIRENFAAAESRIRDTDVAADAAELTRLNILQNAGVSVLSQSNQIPALALSLLR